MRALAITCDACGKSHPTDRRPETWWNLEQLSAAITTGPLDFCSLACLANWVADDRVRAAYPSDFAVRAGVADASIV